MLDIGQSEPVCLQMSQGSCPDAASGEILSNERRFANRLVLALSNDLVARVGGWPVPERARADTSHLPAPPLSN